MKYGNNHEKSCGNFDSSSSYLCNGASGLEVRAQEEKEYYLSDLEWVSATHGDAYPEKTVQRDHPFTLGNNGQDTKISLTMPGGEIKSFDKGIGTVAASPSVITYNIEGAKVSKFHAYFGIDASAGTQDDMRM